MSVYGGPDIVTDGLVLHLDAANRKSYPLTGNIWYDLSGNENNGTLVNGPTYSSDNYGVMSFDGTNDSINIALDSSLQSQYFTYDIWFNLNSTPAGGTPLFMSHYQNNGTISGLTVFEYLGQYRFQTRFNNTCCQNLIVGTSSINKWINFCGTWNGSTKIAYLNGIQVGSQASSGTHSQLNIFTIGNNADNIAVGNYSGAANAKIPTTKYYNRSLSANEVQQNYNALKGRYGLT